MQVIPAPEFRIQNFGNDTECATLDDLVAAVDRYRGQSITIEDLRAGGRPYQVEVLDDGRIYESYGSRPRFDIELRL